VCGEERRVRRSVVLILGAVEKREEAGSLRE